MYHSPGLHAKMKHQIKSIKMANPQEMATYTASSTYRLEKPSQRLSTGNSSAAQNIDVGRVDQFAGGRTLNPKPER